MDNFIVEKILDRKLHKDLIEDNFDIKNEKILITGASGSIGEALTERLKKYDIELLTTDVVGNHTYLDVTDFQNVFSVINKFQPTVLINLAGAKHAPLGEKEIIKTININTIGVKNLLDACSKDCKFILASTCKANNPEIVYGATKLISEKLCMQNNGSVVRFFNVIETSGNVFEIWNNTPKEKPINVVEKCQRHFISLQEGVGLILFSIVEKSGRYIINSEKKINIKNIADKIYPDREKNIIEPRLGDRLIELEKSSSEFFDKYFLNNSVIKIKSFHDKK